MVAVRVVRASGHSPRHAAPLAALGWVHAAKLDEPRGRWVLWADEDELERLSRLRTCPKTWDNQPLLKELTIPKERGR